ncbi:MAG: hypothetical protein ABR899_01950 [Candidatus Krumholzibacteriaceae bacterium]|jgi:hypothetical protein
MRRLAVAIFLLVALSAACRAQISAEGAFFYDRGHYWIELAFRDAAGRDTIPPDLAVRRFEITRLGDLLGGFSPSKVEVVSREKGGPVVILASARLEARSCYRVTYTGADSGAIVVDSICDPFLAPPGGGECGAKAFFRSYIAPAFQKEGDSYNLNQLAYEYDVSLEKSATTIALEPSFKISGLELEPLFEQSMVVYKLERTGKTPSDKRSFGLSVSMASWVEDLRLSLSMSYRDDRSALGIAAGDSVVPTRSLAVEGRVRLDNLFDRANRYCVSVFKGVDVGAGCAWYQTGRFGWSASASDKAAPYVNLRATWTFLYGFQLSYSLQTFWPSVLGKGPTDFQSVRFRLLLRDALPAQTGKSYHPDVEFAYDTGKRLPLFVEEEKVSIGFTFGLYPW